MLKVVTVEEMVAIEKATDAAGTSYAQMMQHAGRAVAEVVMGALGSQTADRRVVILVGPGNNGGDGLVAGRILAEETEAEVSCYLLKPRDDDDEVFVAAQDADVFIATADDDNRWRVLKNLVSAADVVVDALLGTGARLPIEGDLAKLLKHAGTSLERTPFGAFDGDEPGMIWPAAPVAAGSRRAMVVAVDCPSGLDCDTGEVDKVTLPADITVTFAAAKRGQFRFPGAAAVGELIVAGIGTPPDLAELNAVTLDLASGSRTAELLPERSRESHKGTHGRVLAVAGSVNYTGAVALAGEAAYRAGAGLVTLAVPQAIYPMLASQIREAVWLLLPHTMGVINRSALDVLQDEAGEQDALLLGPGLGQEEETIAFMRGLFKGERKAKKGKIGFMSAPEGADDQVGPEVDLPARVIIDADGLNILAKLDEWWTLLPEQTILTPHPGEMARLADMDRDAVQADRVAVAREKAADWGAVIVLKGAFTVVAAPDGRATIIPFATDALATAGTGDVLSGMIAGLLGQGMTTYEAAVAGAYLHGLAGRIAGEDVTRRSAIAGDVLAALPDALALIEGP